MANSGVLDGVDLALVHALHIDGRAPFSRIAEVLDVSEHTVARRYRRLRAEGVLRVVGVLDGTRAGGTAWAVRLTCTPDAAMPVAEALARRADTVWVRLLSGGTEIACGITGGESDDVLLRKLPRTPRIVAMSAHETLHLYAGWRSRATALTEAQTRQLTAPSGVGVSSGQSVAASGGDTERGVAAPGKGTSGGDGRGVAALDGGPEREGAAPGKGPGGGSERRVAPLGRGSSGGAEQSADAPDGGAERGVSTSREGSGRGVAVPRGRGDAGQRGEVEVGPGDLAMVRVLAGDGRAGHAELAEAAGWSQSTVRRRMEVLRATGVLRFDVEVPPSALGYRAEAWLWMKVRPSHLAAVGAALAEHPEVDVAAATTGPSNLMVGVTCVDTRDLYRYLTERVAPLEGVRELETSPVVRTLKRAGKWWPR
ncbi:Lrp/AsnC family transcriptional regulator [Nonomuraea sp. NPDC050556]|uniref:Lrp/AsnC family transcriptional regulator n=1 Tax=Nonomuraea sp. NPDC050556 TaxID=3364369 RepID=UPI0037AFD2AF